ncbi:MAG: hypothetical protein F4118_10600 [Acidimicrobiaceae bacterium]|nr:hypothetical protein [Candidatus Poribacteria bacterium]MYI36859.1 hypothetical protein [Acidimicrobiaceae bacterium]
MSERVELAKLIQAFTRAAMDAVASASDAFRERWQALQQTEHTIDVGATEISIPAIVLEPDSFPYPNEIKFVTDMRVESVEDKIEIVAHGKAFPEGAQRVKVSILFTFGAVPEGYALERERRNSLLSTNLDKANG